MGQDLLCLYNTGDRGTGDYAVPVVLEGKRLLICCEGASPSLACEARNMRADEIHLNATEVEKTSDTATHPSLRQRLHDPVQHEGLGTW